MHNEYRDTEWCRGCWAAPQRLRSTHLKVFMSVAYNEQRVIAFVDFHESDDSTQVAIPFTVTASYEDVSSVTSPGTALGTGQKINFPADTWDDTIYIVFDVTNDQWIGVSEVEIYLDDTDTDDIIIPEVETLSVVSAKTVTNVAASAEYWDLRSDAGCGLAGCDPRLATDGDDNTVAASRWSCTPEDDHVWSETYNFHHCFITFHLDDIYTISYMNIYVHESDDDTKDPVVLDVYTCTGDECEAQYRYNDPDGSFVTTPGLALGESQRLNLPRPEAQDIGIHPNLTVNQWIDISEVEIFVEVTETNVQVAAAEAWTDVTAETLSPVSVRASESVPGFGAALTRPSVGVYDTKPGTPLGEGERVNIVRPAASSLGIFFFGPEGSTAEISEVEIYFEVPDSSPTPAPFFASSDTDEDTSTTVGIADSDDGLGGASSTTTPRAVSDDDSSTAFGGVGDDSPSPTSSDGSDGGGVGAPSSSDGSDGGSGGASSSSALDLESASSGATNVPFGWTFTAMAVGVMSSVFRRATVLLQT
eukprot:jgi/Undpi1/6631/HiC_scaffold_20.g09110.m1